MRRLEISSKTYMMFVMLALFLPGGLAGAARAAPIKALLCTGDYGMWAQDRVKLITGAVNRDAPGKVVFQSDQSFNFVKKLEAPGYAEQFDVIICGDVGLGQMTTRAQEAIVRFINGGGGFIYAVVAKSTIPFSGPREAEPMPLAEILPYQFPANDPARDARADASALEPGAPLFQGLDFSKTPLATGKKAGQSPPVLALERTQGKGKVIALYGAFGASYNYISYAKFERTPGGWDEWPQLGDLWMRLLDRASLGSPVRDRTVQEVQAGIKTVPLDLQAQVDATREIDDIRAGDFSVVSLSQLYNEDGGAGEDLFLALNPRDWLDRQSQKVLPPAANGAHDKSALFAKYHIQGILMADDSFGSYGGWNDARWQTEIESAAAAAQKHPQYLPYFQAGNEPPLDEGYFKFHNRLSSAVLQRAPGLKVIGPNTAFNLMGPDEKGMKAFIDSCGANTDVLNWHTYGVCPESVRDEVLYWTRYAAGKLRSEGPVQVMFTESDIWNSGDSQFNYLMDRAFTFLPMKQVIGNFQYCMRPRSEGGSYVFGVLQPEGDFAANYNGYWAWRNLRGKMVVSQVSGASAEARSHCRVISSSADGGKVVTTIVYYDSGYFDGRAGERSEAAKISLRVKLPPGRYKGERSDVRWNMRRVTELAEPAGGTANVEVTLAPFQAAAFTWTHE